MGFSVRALSPKPGALLPHLFTLTSRSWRSVFCGTFPASHLDWPLASILPCKARTFLPLTLRQAGDLLTNSDENLAKLAHKPPLVQESISRYSRSWLHLPLPARAGNVLSVMFLTACTLGGLLLLELGIWHELRGPMRWRCGSFSTCPSVTSATTSAAPPCSMATWKPPPPATPRPAPPASCTTPGSKTTIAPVAAPAFGCSVTSARMRT
jgi:hypothetical protein